MSLALAVVFLHVLGVVVWIGGVTYQAHVLLPTARRGGMAAFAEAAVRARPVTWTAIALVVLTGFYNVTQLGPLDRVMQSGAGHMLAAKFTLVILAVTLAAQRDFAHVPLLRAALTGGGDPTPPLRTIARLDRAILLLALVVIWLGLAVSRLGGPDVAPPTPSRSERPRGPVALLDIAVQSRDNGPMPSSRAMASTRVISAGESGMPSRRRRASDSASGSPAT